jgi:hypothetical protein
MSYTLFCFGIKRMNQVLRSTIIPHGMVQYVTKIALHCTKVCSSFPDESGLVKDYHREQFPPSIL